MATNPIKSEELIDPQVKKDLKELIEILKELKKARRDIVKDVKAKVKSEDITGKDAAENIANFTEEVNEAAKGIEELTNAEKALIKLQDRLKDATTDNAKEQAKLKVEIQEINKSNKLAAKEALNLVGAYEKESKRLIELRKDFKNLIISEGGATKASDKLLKRISKLDRELKDVDESAGQFQRNVGNYPRTLEKAAKAIAIVAAGTLALKGTFDSIKGSLDSSAEGSEAVREASAKLGGVVSKTKNIVASTVLDLLDFSKALFSGEEGALKLVKGLALNSIGFKLIEEDAEKAEAATSKFFSRTNKATDNLVDSTLELVEAQAELTRRVIQFEKDVRPLEISLAILNGLISQQQILAGDSTRSFDTLAAAILQSQDLQVKRAAINVRIAQEEIEVNRERIRIANLAGGASVELLDQETASITKLIEAENELKNEVLENEKELRQIKQDRLEIDLDILIDGFDNQKTINERIIANDKETLEVRAALFQRTVDLANKSFEGQKKILEDLSKAGIDVEDLLALDATELAEQIRLLEQSEIINTRTLEVIRERRIVLQDLEDAQQDLNEAQQEGIEIQKDIISQEAALTAIRTGDIDALMNLEEQRHENEIENIRERLELVKQGSLEELRLKQQLNDALLREEQERIEKEKELQEELRELRDFAIDSAIDSLNKKADEAISAADEEINATEAQISKQEALAAQGLDNSLKFEQEARAEALLQKIEAEKQKERAEKITAFWNLLSNSDSVQEAIAKFGLGEAFARTIEALPGLEEGGPTPDKESIIRVSEKGSEFVVKHGPAQDYLPQLQAMNKGTYDGTIGSYIDNTKFMPHKLPVNDLNIQLLVAETKGMRQDLKNLVPKIESGYDAQTKQLITIYKYPNRTKTIRQNIPRL